mgnify:CR=1 FL=1
MLTIYGVYRSRASRNIWLAAGAWHPVQALPVMQLYRLQGPEAAKGVLHTQSPEFLKVNPNGHVPSIDDDGLVLHESLRHQPLPRQEALAVRWRPPTWPRTG